MDWFAIVSLGTYPTPTPTAAQRAIYAASWGLLGTAPAYTVPARGLSRFGTDMTTT